MDPTQLRRAKRFQKRFKARKATLQAKIAGEQPVASVSEAKATASSRLKVGVAEVVRLQKKPLTVPDGGGCPGRGAGHPPPFGGDTLSFAATGLPAGLGIDPSSGTIEGTIANSAASSTPYNIVVTASDGIASSSQSFTWNVAYVGVTSPGSQSNVDGATVTLAMTGCDANNNSLSWSETGLPAGLTINSSTGAITGTLGSSDDTSSPYTITGSASDGTFSASQSFAWTITHFALVNPGPQSSAAGSAASLQLSGHDADGDTLSWSSIGLPSGLSIKASTGAITGTMQHRRRYRVRGPDRLQPARHLAQLECQRIARELDHQPRHGHHHWHHQRCRTPGNVCRFLVGNV